MRNSCIALLFLCCACPRQEIQAEAGRVGELVIAFDRSGSMRDQVAGIAKREAIARWLKGADSITAEIERTGCSAYFFNETSKAVPIPPGESSAFYDEVMKQECSGGTEVDRVLATIGEDFKRIRRLVLFTDMEVDDGNELVGSIRDFLRRLGVESLIIIGCFDPDKNAKEIDLINVLFSSVSRDGGGGASIDLEFINVFERAGGGLAITKAEPKFASLDKPPAASMAAGDEVVYPDAITLADPSGERSMAAEISWEGINDVDFHALLKDSSGEIVDQMNYKRKQAIKGNGYEVRFLVDLIKSLNGRSYDKEEIDLFGILPEGTCLELYAHQYSEEVNNEYPVRIKVDIDGGGTFADEPVLGRGRYLVHFGRVFSDRLGKACFVPARDFTSGAPTGDIDLASIVRR